MIVVEDKLLKKLILENKNAPRGGISPTPPRSHSFSFEILIDNRDKILRFDLKKLEKIINTNELLKKIENSIVNRGDIIYNKLGFISINNFKIPNIFYIFSEIYKEVIRNRLNIEHENLDQLILHPYFGYAFHVPSINKTILLPLMYNKYFLFSQEKNYYPEIEPMEYKIRLLNGGINKYNLINLGFIQTSYISNPYNKSLKDLILSKNNKVNILLPFYVIVPEGWFVFDTFDVFYSETSNGVKIATKNELLILDSRIKSDNIYISFKSFNNNKIRVEKDFGYYKLIPNPLMKDDKSLDEFN